MVAKMYTIQPGESITIPCLGCFIFYHSTRGNQFGIATTIGYQTDSTRSRISYINDDNGKCMTISYSASDSQEAYSGSYTITSNAGDAANIVVIGIKGYSKI